MGTFLDRLKGKDLGFWAMLFVLLAALIGFGYYALLHGVNLDGVSIIIGALIQALALLMNYRWGSSKGSKDKTDLLAKKDPGATPGIN